MVEEKVERLAHPQLALVVQVLRPEAVPGWAIGSPPGANFTCRDDGAGPYLKDWGLDGEPPTQAEVDAVRVEQIDAWVVGRAQKRAEAFVASMGLPKLVWVENTSKPAAF